MEVLGLIVIQIVILKVEKFFVAAPGTAILGGVALGTATAISPSRRTTSFLVFVL